MNTKRKQNQSGFTIIELIVVVGIIILMVGMSVPAITAFMKGKSLENAGQLVKSVFGHARRAAVTKKVPHRVVFFSKQNDAGAVVYGMKIYRVSTPYDTDTDKGGYLDKEYLLPEGLTVELYYANSSGTAFDPGTGNGAPAESGFKSDSDPSPFKGKLEFQKNGTVLFGGDFQDVPSFDLEHVMKNGDPINPNITADIIIKQVQSNRRTLCDLRPGVGRVYVRTLRASN